MATVEGKVVRGGRPATNVRVAVGPPSGGSIGDSNTRTNSQGRFAIQIPDSYTQVKVYVDGRDMGVVRSRDFQSFEL